MYNLLIIDDEPEVLEGIVGLFRTAEHLDVEMFQAGSADAAIQLLRNQKIHITITDIRMPGMSGLDIAEMIREEWPECRVIFLSGYDDFEYAQKAMKLGGTDYVLKLDCEEQLVATVEKAVLELNSRHNAETMMRNVEYRFREIRPILLQEFLKGLARGKIFALSDIQSKMSQLDVSLETSKPLMIMMCKVDGRSGGGMEENRSLLLFAVQNIAGEYLNGAFHMMSSHLNEHEIMWLLQPAAEKTTWEKSALIVQSEVEAIQTTVQEYYRRQLSFAIRKDPVGWQSVAYEYSRLQRALSAGFGVNQEIICLERPGNEEREKAAAAVSGDRRTMLDQLRLHVENEDFAGFRRVFEHIACGVDEAQGNGLAYAEMMYGVMDLFSGLMNRLELQGHGEFADDVRTVAAMAAVCEWEEMKYDLLHLAERLIRFKRDSRRSSGSKVIDAVHQYIHANLGSELSLTVLAGAVYLNRNYLSKLYKQETGYNVSEYIVAVRIGKAKELLRQSTMKIHDIAREVGLDSPAYFARVFKKMTGWTPQEFRQSITR